jgi:8-oxo-dGTP pyrophosphatase MutT (NUDIX family)
MIFSAQQLVALLPAVLDADPSPAVTGQKCTAAAVLVPIVCDDPEPSLLLTIRTEVVETHKGQISFPGGVVEKADADASATALRETEEEIGMSSQSVRVCGYLPGLATPTGFCIVPVVGVIERLPALRPNANEVAEVFRAPLSFFLDERNGRREERWLEGRAFDIWFYDFGGRVIWGATGRIIHTLVERLRMAEGDGRR